VADDRHDLRVTAMELQLRRSHVEPAYFHGYLMLPLLREGDEVEVEPVSWSDLRVGDVVTYRDATKFPTRRVMEIRSTERTFVIMGDSVRPRRTWAVPFDDVLARVVRRRRDGVWMTTRHWRWRAQRTKVLLRYRLPSTPVGTIVRGVRGARARWRR
jgi:hypothetical protein